MKPAPGGVEERIRERIRREGPLPVSEFMRAALYDPEDGYYMKERSVFGREGDYYTAPQVHAVYGRTLARWIAERAKGFGWEIPDIVEFGAGTGHLAEQILGWFRERGMDVRYHIVELSEIWRRRQEIRLAPFKGSVSWGVPWPAVRRAVVLAHELLDAMPVHVLRRSEGRLWEIRVGLDGRDRWLLVQGECSPEARLALEEDPVLTPEEAVFEIGPEALNWVREVLSRLREGVVLVVDYGDEEEALYGPHRPEGTLRAFRRHQCLSAWWEEPGSRDITADVNFSAVRRAALRAGASVGPLTTLAQFLWRAGIGGELQAVDPADPFHSLARRNRAVKQLLFPGGFGFAFRVMEIRKGVGEAC
ncbi:MAG: SAM-dependent methyltransferase [Alicyclobacillaceae bacterium]|nr:SAM-dependent methyltransferase [Alicyclobacillaceae bacterium]